VKVTATVTAALSKSTAPLRSAVTMSGKVSAGSGSTATLQRKSGSAWVDVAAAAVAGNGSYSLKVPTSVSGVSTYAVFVTGPTVNATRSAAKTLSVYSASITKVKASGAEYVVVKNTGKVSISLSGMKLKDKAGKSLTLPRFTLAPGKSVSVFTGKGKSTTKLVHVGAKVDAWSTHDITKLIDSRGALVSQKKY
jgi:Lamin Tail Domain